MRPLTALSTMVAGFFLSVLAACDTSLDEFRDDLKVLGATAEIVIVGVPSQKAAITARAVEKDLEMLTHVGYSFEPGSELYKLNEAISQGQSIAVSPDLKRLIEAASKLYSQSDGLFNPAMGELTALWEYQCDKVDCVESPYSEEVRHLVEKKESEVISLKPSMEDLIFDGDKLTSQKPVVKLEFGDVIRGVALDKGIAHLKELGVENAMLSIGSGVRTLGSRGGKPWRIGLPRHASAENMAGTIESTGDEAAVTVHAFEKSIGKEGSVYRHVVDPRSGLPVKETRSVTVIHDSAATANAAAAALLINGRKGWAGLAGKMDIQSVMMVTRDGAIYTSPKMEERITWKHGVSHHRLAP